MEACLAPTAPPSELARADIIPPRPHGLRWIRLALAATLVIGLLWRVVRYLAQFPIWGDEAMLLLNILDRDYIELTQHLHYSQVAPLLFLWLEKTALLTFGSSECSMHFFPFLAGLAAVLVFFWSCHRSSASIAAGLAVAILAVSYYPVRHGCEVKPYAFDLLYAVLFASLTLEYLRQPQQHRWLMLLIAVTPLAVFSSYPSVFVGGAVSLVVLPAMRTASWSQRSLYALFNVVLLVSFLVHYGVVGHQQIDTEEAEKTREFLRSYWKDAFPPDSYARWPLWLLQIHTGNMLAYPNGANHGGSTATFVLVLLGSFALWRTGQRSLLALCWLPFGLNLVAAILHKYPFGDSARITLHLAPFICILVAHGIAFALESIRSVPWRTRLHLALYLCLCGYGIASIVRDLRQPYKTAHDRETRQFVRDLARQAGNEPILMCHQSEKVVLAELAWYLRTELSSIHWLADASLPLTGAKSCWLVLCSQHEPGVSEVMTSWGDRALQGWRVVESDVRVIPGENLKMSPVHCRTVRLIHP